MPNIEKSPATLLDELAALDPPRRRRMAGQLRKVAETSQVPDGKTASHVLGVLGSPARRELTGDGLSRMSPVIRCGDRWFCTDRVNLSVAGVATGGTIHGGGLRPGG